MTLGPTLTASDRAPGVEVLLQVSGDAGELFLELEQAIPACGEIVPASAPFQIPAQARELLGLVRPR